MSFKVAICAGHGGYKSLNPKVYATAGKRTPDGEPEWEFNNKVAIAFTNELSKYEGVEVRRYDDITGKTDIPLSTRTNGANSWGADIYISFHQNGYLSTWGDHTGIETFRGSSADSIRLANLVHLEMVKAYGLRDRGIKTANLWITSRTKMPSILVEGGFMDSRIDIVKLRDDKVLENAGIGVAKAVVTYAGLKLKPQLKVSQQHTQHQSAKVTFEGNSVEALLINGTTQIWTRDLANLLQVPVNFVNGHVVLNHVIIPKEEVTLIDGKSYMHSRKIAEYLGLNVGWEQASKTVTLSK